LKKLVIILMLSLCSVAYAASASDTIPKSFNKTIIKFIVSVCEETGVSPELIYAIIHVESKWKMRAKNYNPDKSIDYGLMQLNSRYIQDFVWKYGISGRDYDPIKSVYDNLEIGIKHVARLQKYWKGDLLRVLYSYNCGVARTSTGNIPSRTRIYAWDIIKIYYPPYAELGLLIYKENKE